MWRTRGCRVRNILSHPGRMDTDLGDVVRVVVVMVVWVVVEMLIVHGLVAPTQPVPVRHFG